MASVKENRKDGKIVSYRFSVCLGRNADGTQIRETKTWKLPKGIGQKTARKEAEKQAALWEESLKKEPEEHLAPVSLASLFKVDSILLTVPIIIEIRTAESGEQAALSVQR